MKRKSRRSNREGTIYWDEKLQRYVGQFTYEDPISRKMKRKKITKVKQKDVIQAGRSFQEKLVCQRNRRGNGHLTISILVDKWLGDIKPTLKIKTFERYEGVMKSYFIPYYGEKLIEEVSVESLQKHFLFLRQEGGIRKKELSARSVGMTRTILGTFYAYAIRNGYISSNTAMNTKALRSEGKEKQIFSQTDYKKLIDAASKHSENAYLVLRLAFGTGCRIGEIFGLEYDAVDWDCKMIAIQQTVVSSKSGKTLQKSAKNKTSIRKILLTDDLMGDIRNAYDRHLERREKYRNKFNQAHNFIIEHENGDFCDPSYFSYKIFKKLLREAGLNETYRMHDCRHTHATWLLEKGVNIKVISERLGHKSIRTTLDIYSHVTVSMQEEAVVALNEISGTLE